MSIVSFFTGSWRLLSRYTTADMVFLAPRARSFSVQRSLSVLLPVKNVQATLDQAVHEILEVVADSSEQFELLIIDDGSTDATSEVAHELRRHYPQIRVVRHGVARGREAAIRTGLERSRGEVVMLRDDERGFSLLERPQATKPAVTSRPSRPNYLSRLKNFALDE
jgi:cellulose synthase/poly-beta-1,6-N-acetylglucosamine synthase-like glycosyltransferase